MREEDNIWSIWYVAISNGVLLQIGEFENCRGDY